MIDIMVEQKKDVIVMRFNGEFYMESIQYAEDVWKREMLKHPKVVGIDCSKIAYIDSSAIGILVKFLHSATAHGANMIFYDLSGSVEAVFKTAKLNTFFNTMSKSEFEVKYF